jgi:hypothetical protein
VEVAQHWLNIDSPQGHDAESRMRLETSLKRTPKPRARPGAQELVEKLGCVIPGALFLVLWY